MLFVTNRVLRQTHRSRAGREVDFDLRDNSALPSLFFLRRKSEGKYEEVLSGPFLDEIRQAAASNLLLYFHGFRSLPEEPIFPRAESLQRDLGNDTLVIPVIWPCASDESNVVDRYYGDQLSADMSGFAFARAMKKLEDWQAGLDAICSKRINVFAHSMGARVLRETLRVWRDGLREGVPPLLFRNSFLVAADVINETLEEQHAGWLISAASRNVVSYFAADDLALRASKVANATQVSRRLGHTGPYDMSRVAGNVYARDCSNFNTEHDPPTGHSYFEPRDGIISPLTTDVVGWIETGRPPDPARSLVLGIES